MKQLKKLFVLTLLLISFAGISAAQERESKSRKEIRAERQQKRIDEVQELIEKGNFVFKATHALPMGGGSIQLDFSYDAELRNDTIVSFLPFFGVAYRVDYGGRNSAFDFTLPVENMEINKVKDGYRVSFDVKNKMDYLNYNFNISEPGYATLNIISTNRQAISYYGSIEAP
jgi:TctA family transporter